MDIGYVGGGHHHESWEWGSSVAENPSTGKGHRDGHHVEVLALQKGKGKQRQEPVRWRWLQSRPDCGTRPNSALTTPRESGIQGRGANPRGRTMGSDTRGGRTIARGEASRTPQASRAIKSTASRRIRSTTHEYEARAPNIITLQRSGSQPRRVVGWGGGLRITAESSPPWRSIS